MKKILMTLALCAAGALSAPAMAAGCEAVVESNDAMQFNVKSIDVPKSCKKFSVTLKHVGKMPKTAMGHNIVVSTAADMQAVITDGPFLESKEYLGGFWVVLADDLDAALALAQRASAACRNQIEVRPFQGEADAGRGGQLANIHGQRCQLGSASSESRPIRKQMGVSGSSALSSIRVSMV